MRKKAKREKKRASVGKRKKKKDSWEKRVTHPHALLHARAVAVPSLTVLPGTRGSDAARSQELARTAKL